MREGALLGAFFMRMTLLGTTLLTLCLHRLTSIASGKAVGVCRLRAFDELTNS